MGPQKFLKIVDFTQLRILQVTNSIANVHRLESSCRPPCDLFTAQTLTDD